MLQRNNLIRLHLLLYVRSGFFHGHLICHPLKYTMSKHSQVTGYLKTTVFVVFPEDKAKPSLTSHSFLSDWTLVSF